MTRADLLALGLGALVIAAAVLLIGVAVLDWTRRGDRVSHYAILGACVASLLAGLLLAALYLLFGTAAMLFGLAALLMTVLAIVSLRGITPEGE